MMLLKSGCDFPECNWNMSESGVCFRWLADTMSGPFRIHFSSYRGYALHILLKFMTEGKEIVISLFHGCNKL